MPHSPSDCGSGFLNLDLNCNVWLRVQPLHIFATAFCSAIPFLSCRWLYFLYDSGVDLVPRTPHILLTHIWGWRKTSILKWVIGCHHDSATLDNVPQLRLQAEVVTEFGSKRDECNRRMASLGCCMEAARQNHLCIYLRSPLCWLLELVARLNCFALFLSTDDTHTRHHQQSPLPRTQQSLWHPFVLSPGPGRCCTYLGRSSLKIWSKKSPKICEMWRTRGL